MSISPTLALFIGVITLVVIASIVMAIVIPLTRRGKQAPLILTEVEDVLGFPGRCKTLKDLKVLRSIENCPILKATPDGQVAVGGLINPEGEISFIDCFFMKNTGETLPETLVMKLAAFDPDLALFEAFVPVINISNNVLVLVGLSDSKTMNITLRRVSRFDFSVINVTEQVTTVTNFLFPDAAQPFLYPSDIGKTAIGGAFFGVDTKSFYVGSFNDTTGWSFTVPVPVIGGDGLVYDFNATAHTFNDHTIGVGLNVTSPTSIRGLYMLKRVLDVWTLHLDKGIQDNVAVEYATFTSVDSALLKNTKDISCITNIIGTEEAVDGALVLQDNINLLSNLVTATPALTGNSMRFGTQVAIDEYQQYYQYDGTLFEIFDPELTRIGVLSAPITFPDTGILQGTGNPIAQIWTAETVTFITSGFIEDAGNFSACQVIQGTCVESP